VLLADDPTDVPEEPDDSDDRAPVNAAEPDELETKSD
jgi:hypothetical protein